MDAWDKREAPEKRDMANGFCGELDAFVLHVHEMSENVGKIVKEIRKENTEGFTLRGALDSLLIYLEDVEKARAALENALAEAMSTAHYIAEDYEDEAAEQARRELDTQMHDFYKERI